jgi:hypothetical protein
MRRMSVFADAKLERNTSMGSILVALVTVFVVAGVLSLLLILIAWDSVASWYSSSYAKFFVSISRLISTFVVAKYVVIQEIHAVVAFYLAVASIFLWETLGLWIDQKKKLAFDRNAALQDQFMHRNRLLTCLRELDNHNKHRLDEEVKNAGSGRVTIENLRRALNANVQVRRILDQVGAMLKSESPERPDGSVQNFRIGYYIECNGYMKESKSIRLDTQAECFLKSYKLESVEEHFRVDCRHEPAQVVKCVQEQRLIIVSDCATQLVRFFHEEQKNYLKSMVAYPINDFGCGSVDKTRAAIVIDTDEVGYFKEEDRTKIEACLKEFGRKLALVNSFSRLVNSEGRKVNANPAIGQ